MKNKITDLNNHLFAQLERLGDEDITEEQLAKEINRSKAITTIAGNIIDSSRVTLEAMKVMEKAGADISKAGDNILQLKSNDE